MKIAKVWWTLVVSLAAGLPSLLKAADATQEFLQMVPGSSVTLDMIAYIGFQHADQIKIYESEFDLRDSALMETQSQLKLGGQLNSNMSLISDQLERQQTGFPSPNRTVTSQLQSSYLRNMPSGTQIDSKLTLQNAGIDWPSSAAFPQLKDQNVIETRFEVGVQQSLWRNAWGQSTQNLLQVAQSSSQAIDLQYENQVADWLTQLAQIYSSAWFVQRKVEANQERLETQKRLLKITRLLTERGTAEQADVLNVEAQVLNAQQSLEDTLKQLRDIWRQLAVALKLPARFLDADPRRIPLIKSEIKENFTGACAGGSKASIRSPQVALIKLQLENARLKLQAQQSLSKPELFARVALAANGIDDQFGSSVSETGKLSHPQLVGTLGLNIQLDNFEAKAQIQRLSKDVKVLELQLAQLDDQLQVSWMNNCREIQRLNAVIQTQKQIVSLNQKRTKLEEERFKLGRVDVRNAIVAANDLISARLTGEGAEKDLIDKQWELKKLRGEVLSYLKELVKRNPLQKAS